MTQRQTEWSGSSQGTRGCWETGMREKERSRKKKVEERMEERNTGAPFYAPLRLIVGSVGRSKLAQKLKTPTVLPV